jgi:AraC-like DNA-binding protein
MGIDCDPSWFQPHVLSGGIAKTNRGRKSPGYRQVAEPLPWFTLYVIENGKIRCRIGEEQAQVLHGPVAIVFPPSECFDLSVPALSEYSWIEWGWCRAQLEPREFMHQPPWEPLPKAWRYSNRERQPTFHEQGIGNIPYVLSEGLFEASRLLCRRVNGLWWRSQLDWYRANNLLGEWLIVLAKQYGLFQHAQVNTDDTIQRSIATAHKQIEQILTVDMWADILHVSSKTLNNRLKEATGMTAKQHLDAIRLENALTRLKALRPISEVAKFSGFGSRTSFARWFKVTTGFTPSQWREANVQE